MKKRTVIIFIPFMLVLAGIISIKLMFAGIDFIFSKDILVATKDLHDYGKFQEFTGYSNLDIFPEELPKSASEVDFYYEVESQLFDDSCQVYLNCKYDGTDFEAEYQRLMNISESYKGSTNYVWSDPKKYKYPAVVAIDNNNSCYEYALINHSGSQIIYIFLQFKNKENIYFIEDFLPKNYGDSSQEGNSIYLFDIGNGTKHVNSGKWKNQSGEDKT